MNFYDVLIYHEPSGFLMVFSQRYAVLAATSSEGCPGGVLDYLLELELDKKPSFIISLSYPAH